MVGFTLKSSTDKENIMMVESKNYNQNDILVMIFNQYNLEIISKMRVDLWDLDFNESRYDLLMIIMQILNNLNLGNMEGCVEQKHR